MMKCCYISSVLTFVLILGTKNKLELDYRSCLAGVSSECKYAGCLDESA